MCGVTNKPKRDAVLLHQTLVEEQLDYHRLTYQITRLHRDQQHLRAVDWWYTGLFSQSLELAVRQVTKGSYGELMATIAKGGPLESWW